MAFRWANKSDPNAILFLNDFGIEIPGSYIYYADRDQQMWNLIRELKNRNVPIHGVGFQMHLYGLDFANPEKTKRNAESLEQNISKYRQAGVDVYVTEFDLRLGGVGGTQQQRFEIQGQAYRAIYQACLNAGVKSFTMFGLTDKLSWLEDPTPNPPHRGSDADPCPFDDNYGPKPAYFALLGALQEEFGQRFSSSGVLQSPTTTR